MQTMAVTKKNKSINCSLTHSKMICNVMYILGRDWKTGEKRILSVYFKESFTIFDVGFYVNASILE